MKTNATFGVARLCLMTCLAAACTSTTPLGSHFVKSQLISAAQGGTVTVTASDDAHLAGLTVTIPPNALAADTTITVAEGSQVPYPANGTTAAVSADLGPEGTTFASLVTITLPYTLPASVSVKNLEIVAVDDQTGVTTTIPNASLTLASGAASFQVSALGRFGGVFRPPLRPPAPRASSTVAAPATAGAASPTAATSPAVWPVQSSRPTLAPSARRDQTECCGVCGSGIACPAIACLFDGGSGGCSPGETYCACTQQCVPPGYLCPDCEPLDGGSPVCPPGETPCCPGDPNSCVPLGAATCVDPACNAQDAGLSCPPGDYFCSCPGSTEGTCIPDKQVCALPCAYNPDAGTTGACTTASDCTGGLPQILRALLGRHERLRPLGLRQWHLRGGALPARWSRRCWTLDLPPG